MVEKTCENCANAASCQKTIGYMFGFCNTDFKPKEQPKKGSADHE